MDFSPQDLPFDVTKISSLIPHRYPFLLIDRVVDLKPGEYLKAIKCISMGEQLFQGHFPGKPIFPAVLILDGLAQGATILGRFSMEHYFKEVMFTGIENARFKMPVTPGDVLSYRVDIKKFRKNFGWFKGEAFVGDELAASCDFSAYMK